MRVVVLGAGALGSVVGGCLALAGNQVVLLARPDQAAAIRRHGLKITGLKEVTVPVAATADPSEVAEADLLLVTVKTRATSAALDSVAHLQAAAAASLQNGVVKNEQLAARFGPKAVVGASTIIGASLVAPGVAEYTNDGWTYFGEPDGAISPRVERIVQMFNAAGLKTEVRQDIASVEWSKLCQVAPAMVLSAMTRLEYHKVCRQPDLAALHALIGRECAAVARASGVEVGNFAGFEAQTLADASLDEAVGILVRRGEMLEGTGRTNIRISMLQDLLAGRKTEIEETAGFVVRRARELGVPVPTTEFAYRVVKGIDDYL